MSKKSSKNSKHPFPVRLLLRSKISSNPRSAWRMAFGISVALIVISSAIFSVSMTHTKVAQAQFVKQYSTIDQRVYSSVKNNK